MAQITAMVFNIIMAFPHTVLLLLLFIIWSRKRDLNPHLHSVL